MYSGPDQAMASDDAISHIKIQAPQGLSPSLTWGTVTFKTVFHPSYTVHTLHLASTHFLGPPAAARRRA
jgi:hypothetical protein